MASKYHFSQWGQAVACTLRERWTIYFVGYGYLIHATPTLSIQLTSLEGLQ